MRGVTRRTVLIGGGVAAVGVAGLLVADATPPPPPAEPPHPPELPVRFATANGLRFGYLEAGEGPPVLLLHGFPDSAWSWAGIIRRLADSGYRAIAPFTRGYHPTDLAGNDDYSLESLARDAIGLLDALGAERPVIVGHDWGASTAYVAVNIAPDRFRGIATLAIPHPRVTELTPEVAWNFPHFLLFQAGPLSEWWARRGNFAYVRSLFTYWSPSWDVPEAQVAQMLSDFSRPGRLHAALSYYSAFAADQNEPARVGLYTRQTAIPALSLVGEEDIAWRIGMFKRMPEAFTGPFEMVTTPTAGHFVQHEEPEFVAQHLLRFIASLPA